ncbi:hypothetical protein [Dyadobacter psychrotolerans]|uniref:General stress protein 17M-like domain-containing protein n=1 Tax=Dyadobacter psychrotolerans TaxID=2541721 RepID=A0A4R5D9L0_9BACT|nr:hypothetical protein [Dyadobacter psychrotolerans]TDE10256.1 hypothetical protein E0F88_28600 [Dyadobacter psychrotolerans]
METNYNTQDTCTVTGIFATREDAENAFHILIELGYTPEEITLIMSEETQEKLYNPHSPQINFTSIDKDKTCVTISDAINTLGKYISFPGVALMVAADLNDGGVRALTGSVMSERYAQYFRTRINDGEIVIDFKPHSVLERNIVAGLWENYGGDPLVRHLRNVA